jgi:hypothetical protein
MVLVNVALEELSFVDRVLALVKYVKVSINCNSFRLLYEVQRNKKFSLVSRQEKTRLTTVRGVPLFRQPSTVSGSNWRFFLMS